MCVSVCNANIMSRHCAWKKCARDFFFVLFHVLDLEKKKKRRRNNL